jgi:DNA-directed RNA polymerase subunit alpha
MIMLDALFTPVTRVRYKVENTRVGQITDLDKLLNYCRYRRSISPREAFEEAAALLVNQYTALAGQTRVEAASPLAAAGGLQAFDEENEDPAELMTSVEDLNLSARTTNALSKQRHPHN